MEGYERIIPLDDLRERATRKRHRLSFRALRLLSSDF